LIERSADENDRFFVSDIVLAELAWTLERTYGFDKAAVGVAFKALADSATLGFESRDTLRLALAIFADAKVGFADCLIVAKAQAHGCRSLVTFDKAMRALPSVDLL
jgi:predicted nucleic-acid-binding protein